MYRVATLVPRTPLRAEGFYPWMRRQPGPRRPPQRCGLGAFSTVEAAAVEQTATRARSLTMATLNPQVKAVEYAVRGPIVMKAGDIEREMQQVSALTWSVS